MKNLSTSLIKNKASGIYQLRYKFSGDDRWTQHSLETRNKREASDKRAEFVASSGLNRDESIAALEARIAALKRDCVASDISIASAWKTFRSNAVASFMADSTLCGYESYAKSLIKFFGADHDLSNICHKNTIEYVTRLANNGYGKSTVSRHIKFFRRMWAECVPKISNPWIETKAIGNGKMSKKLPFKTNDVRALINGSSEEWKLLYMIMAYSGVRLIDACLLSVEDIDFDRHVIEMYPRKTKNRGDNPVQMKCGLHPELELVLRGAGIRRGYFMQEISEMYTRDKSSVSKKIQRDIISLTGLVTVVKPEGRSRGVAVYGAHSFRKFLSDRMREAGVDPMVRLKIMGHKDAATELQDYSHVSDKEVLSAIKLAIPDSLCNHGIIQMRRAG